MTALAALFGMPHVYRPATVRRCEKIRTAKNPRFPSARGLIRSLRKRCDEPSKGFVSPLRGRSGGRFDFFTSSEGAVLGGCCRWRTGPLPDVRGSEATYRRHFMVLCY